MDNGLDALTWFFRPVFLSRLSFWSECFESLKLIVYSDNPKNDQA